MSDVPDALLGPIRRCIQAGAVRVSSYGYDELAARLCSCRCSWKANLNPASSQDVRHARLMLTMAAMDLQAVGNMRGPRQFADSILPTHRPTRDRRAAARGA